ncbi:MAG: DUF192 domain-containing protein [Candidatus Micrarchaeota archaeon]|nr:DUF192 domain-containing protein [Candidatus Micrarchaeota archaeon]
MRIRGIRLIDGAFVRLLYPLIRFFGPYCKKTQVAVSGKRYDAYVADNFFSRAFGYMFRDSKDLKRNEAMLFVFDSPRTVPFTMSNVYFPIRIFALDKDYKVLDSALMVPGQKQKTKLTGTLFLEIPLSR